MDRGTEARAQESKILTTRTDHQSKYDPSHEVFWEKVKLLQVCRQLLRVSHAKSGETLDQMDPVRRARVAETCESGDESPSSNLGRVKQGEAIRVDGMDLQVKGQASATKRQRTARTRASLTQSCQPSRPHTRRRRWTVASGDRGHAPDVLAAVSTGAGKRAKKAPPGTSGGSIKCTHVCVEGCPLTTRHEARPRPGAATTAAREM